MHYSPTGVCQHYDGNCSARLNSTEPRYINTSIGFNETENIASTLLGIVKSSFVEKKSKNSICEEILEKTVCFFVFPFCSPQQTKLDYCREDCNYLFEICGDDLNQVISLRDELKHFLGRISMYSVLLPCNGST